MISEQIPAMPPTQHARKRLLLVDDEVILVRVLTKVLEDHYDLKTAATGRQAMAVCGEWAPDIVVTNLNMPEVDGRELLAWLRRKHPTIPVLIITGMGGLETAAWALREGAAGFIGKPFGVEHLLTAIPEAMKTTPEAVERRESWAHSPYLVRLLSHLLTQTDSLSRRVDSLEKRLAKPEREG